MSRGRYPPNPVASVVLASLGQPSAAWHGAVAIVGVEDKQGLTASLTVQQLGLIDRAYRLATGSDPVDDWRGWVAPGLGRAGWMIRVMSNST